jgi:hypothetical protein
MRASTSGDAFAGTTAVEWRFSRLAKWAAAIATGPAVAVITCVVSVISPLAVAWQNIAATVRCLVLPVGRVVSSFRTISVLPTRSVRSGVSVCVDLILRIASAAHVLMS